MSKIYEIDRSLYKKIEMYPTNDKFIFTTKGKQSVIAVDNSNGQFFVEDFSNKTKALIYLVNDSFLPNDVEKEYKENKTKYKNYKKIVSSQNDYFIDRDLYDRDFLDFDSNKKYRFDIDIGYGRKSFKSTIKDALSLASNYESDLVFNDRLIYSPLGFEWEYNKNLVKRYLGKNFFDNNKHLPYVFKDDDCIEWLNKNKEIKI